MLFTNYGHTKKLNHTDILNSYKVDQKTIFLSIQTTP